jgi:hypothetical protein
MIDIQFSQPSCASAGGENAGLQQYVRALLARQQALDLLESIHQQINQVWASMRRLLDGRGAAARAQAVRAARAAQAAKAQSSYRTLEKRREECIAALHQAELTANVALQKILVASSQPASQKTPDSAVSQKQARRTGRSLCHSAGRKLKNAFSA